MKISLIIPCYNVECYIKKCLDSCFKQNLSLNEYEVIVVNDGSPDRSLAIAENFTRLYSNITILSQVNQGLSVARNNGLRIAKGDYVWFIDSDDWIEENCLNDICNELRSNVDLLQVQYRYVYDNKSLNRDAPICKIEIVVPGKNKLLKGDIPAAVPFTIYRKDFLLKNNLEFYPRIYHEDSEFKPRALYLAKSIKSYNKVVYNYYQRPVGSIMSQFKLKNGRDILQVNNNLILFAEQQKMEDCYLSAFYSNVGLNLNSLLSCIHQLNYDEQQILTKDLEMNKHQFHKMLHSRKIKYKFEALFFCISVHLGLWINKMIR